MQPAIILIVIMNHNKASSYNADEHRAEERNEPLNLVRLFYDCLLFGYVHSLVSDVGRDDLFLRPFLSGRLRAYPNARTKEISRASQYL